MAKPNPALEYRLLSRKSAPAVGDDGHSMSGRAAPFSTTTMIGEKPWGFRETIAPGAFAKSVKDGDVVLLDQHDTAKPIARQSAGTLSLQESKDGLDWDATPANTTYANDAVENAKARNYGGCSFGFQVVRDSWKYNEDDDVDERTLQEVKLFEISTVTFPAYGDTMVSARSNAEAAFELSIVGRAGNPKPYGEVDYADPKNGKYPIDTKAHAQAAWSYINQDKNAAEYPLNGVTLASVKAKIKAACKKFGITISEDKNSAEIESIVEQYNELPDELKRAFRDAIGSPEEAAEPDTSTRDEADADAALAKQIMDRRKTMADPSLNEPQG